MEDDEAWKKSVELRLNSLELIGAVEAERYLQLNKRLEAIDGHLSWIFKILVGGILMALVTFIIKGGLIV